MTLFFVRVELGLDRRDTQGNRIDKNTERHKISFRDKVKQGSTVEDVHHVESYKKYNQMDDGDEQTTICRCAIF